MVGWLVDLVLGGDNHDPVVALVQNVTNGLASIADGVVSMLPNASNLGLTTSTGWIQGYAWANVMVPLPEAIACLGIIVTVKTGIFLYRVADRIWHTIPKPLSGT